MIEVEKKFRPTEEQLAKLLEDAEFFGEKILQDLYYDYPDCRLFKQGIRLRGRNGSYELKLGDGVAEEIEGEENIKKYFKINKPLAEFVKENFIELINYTTVRKKYKKGEFSIDVDSLDFGYKCIEIELMVRDRSEVEIARKKIIDLAKRYDFEIKDIPSKREEYFRLLKPEVYKMLY